jgi:WD40 repeat protein
MRARLLSFSGAIGLLAGAFLLAPIARGQAKDGWAPAAVLKDQKGSGWFLAFSPDGKTLAAACGGVQNLGQLKLPNSVRLWDVQKGKLIRTLVGDGPIVQGLAFNSNGKQLVIANFDGSFRRLDVATGTEVNRIRVGDRMNTVNFTPDRKLVLLVNPKAVQGQLRIQNEYQLRDVDTGKLVKPARPFPRDTVHAVGPDGRSLVISVMQPLDPNVKLPPGVVPLGGPMPGFLWDAKTGHQTGPLLKGNLTAAMFSPDGKLVLLTNLDLGTDPAVHFWNVAEKKLCAEKIPLTRIYNAFAFAPDSSLLAAAANDRTVRLFETAKMTEVGALNDLTGFAEVVQFAPDGNMLAAAQADGTIRLWTRKGR